MTSIEHALSSEDVYWSRLKSTYGALSFPEAREILKILENDKEKRYSELLKTSKLDKGIFNNNLERLTKYDILEKTTDRYGIEHYRITIFARDILRISSKLLDEIQECKEKQ